MNYKKVYEVAKREFIVTVRRKSFIFMALFLPFIVIVPGALSMFISQGREAEVREAADRVTLPVVDYTGIMREQAARTEPEPRPAISLVEQVEAERRLLEGESEYYYVIPENYIDSGEAQYVSCPDAPRLRRGYHYEISDWIRRELLYTISGISCDDVESADAIPEDAEPAADIESADAIADLQKSFGQNVANRIVQGMELVSFELIDGEIVPEGDEMIRMLRRFVLPYLFAFIFPMMLFTAGGYLVQGVAEEKSNRIVEVLLAALSADELFMGKLVGLGLAAVLQGGIWLLTGWAGIIFFSAGLRIITFKAVVVAVAFFITGYLSLGALMLGFGSLGSTPAESQAWSFVVTFFGVISLIVAPSMLEQADGLVMRLMTWFPLTAPVIVNFRVAFGEPPAWDLGLGFVISLGSVFVFIAVSARLWKAGMLMRGMAPGLSSLKALWEIICAGSSVRVLPTKAQTAGISNDRQGADEGLAGHGADAALVGHGSDTAPALYVEQLNKRFGANVALDNVSLKLMPGAALGLIGPNGAGKTTLIRCIMNMLLPDNGDLLIFNRKPGVITDGLIGYLPEERGLYSDSTVMENLCFFGHLRGLCPEETREKALNWLSRVDLESAANRKIRDCSKGMQQKIQLGVAMIHNPDILVLDEPFSGLDPVSRVDMTDIISEEKARGVTLIFSTHVMQQAEDICDEVALINHGRIVVNGPLEEIRRTWSQQVWRVTGETKPPEITENTSWVESERGWLIKLPDHCNEEQFTALLLKKLAESGYVPYSFERVLATLDEVFLRACKQ